MPYASMRAWCLTQSFDGLFGALSAYGSYLTVCLDALPAQPGSHHITKPALGRLYACERPLFHYRLFIRATTTSCLVTRISSTEQKEKKVARTSTPHTAGACISRSEEKTCMRRVMQSSKHRLFASEESERPQMHASKQALGDHSSKVQSLTFVFFIETPGGPTGLIFYFLITKLSTKSIRQT